MSFPIVELRSAGVSVLDCEHKTPKAQSSGHPYIAIPDVQAGRINTSTARRISTADLIDWNRRTTPAAGDILVTRRGRVGDTAPIPVGEQVAIGQNLVLLRSTGSQVDQTYLRWAARSPQWWSEVERLLNVGAIFNSLNVKDIGRIKIPIPPLGCQRSITNLLDALDDKIAANTQLADSANQLGALVTRSCLDLSLRVALSSLAKVTMGSSPLGASLNETRLGTVFYQGVRDFGVRFPRNRVWTTEPGRIARPLDSLLSVRAPVGQVNMASETTCIGRGLASVRSLTSQPFTLFHLLRDDPDVWAPYDAEGTVFGSINRGQLEAVTVPTIRGGMSQLLEERLSALETRIAAALAESATLVATRDALLPQLMSGKLRVIDVEKSLAGVL